MFKIIRNLVYLLVVFLMASPLVSCSGGGGGTGTGTLGISLTDATTDQYQAIYVTINEVRVKHENHEGWDIVPDLALPQTFNLLELVNGVMADLGVTELEAGHYNQMRLIIEDSDAVPEPLEDNILGNPHPYYNYLIDANDTEIPLKVPSGGNTGIKLVSGFDIVNGGATELVLDFDALRSIVHKGNGGFSLKPTIKVLETVENSVGGIIDDGTDRVGGALVSAQIYTPPPEPLDGWDPKDEVTVAGGTVSFNDPANLDEYGTYLMFLPPNTYNIVVTKEGFSPACTQVEAEFYEAYTADVTLAVADISGTFSGSVTGLAIADGSAVFSIRQPHDPCGMIEVASVSVANTVDPDPLIYSVPIILPVGTYEVVVSSEGEITQVFDVVVEDGADAVLDVDFTPAP